MNIKIGNTPMIKINYTLEGEEGSVFVKLEQYNITGSIKDRVAYYIIKKAYERGDLVKGKEIVEATSGNTGIALSALGAYFGNPVHIFMPDWVSRERLDLMKMYGAKVTLISKEEGGFKRAISAAKEYAKENNAFFSNQFENEDNILAHFETTGEEIVEKIDDIGGFVSGIGTGGTLIGISRKLKEKNKDLKVIALEPDKMPLLKENRILGEHKIEGIGDDFIPKIVDRGLIDDIVLINDEDAINMSRILGKTLGLGVGISSGANLLASIMKAKDVNGKMVTVFADDSKKYLSTDLSKPINDDKSLFSNKIKIKNYEFIQNQLT